MPTPQEQLARLEERFIMGDIDEASYRREKAALEAAVQSPADAPPQPPAAGTAPAGAPKAGSTIDNSVIKGNVTTNTGAAQVGSISINLGGDRNHGTGNVEIEYERSVMLILRSGGSLRGARAELDRCRQHLSISLRLAGEIEKACLQAMGLPGPESSAAAGPAQRQFAPPPPPPPPPAGLASVQIVFEGVWMLIDASVQVYLDGQLVGSGSVKKGFSIPLQVLPCTHQLFLQNNMAGIVQSQTVALPLARPGNYLVKLSYSRMWGNFEATAQINFLG